MYKILHIPSGTYLLMPKKSYSYLSEILKSRIIWSKIEISLYSNEYPDKYCNEGYRISSELKEKMFITKLSAKKWLSLYLKGIRQTLLVRTDLYKEYDQENFYEIVEDE